MQVFQLLVSKSVVYCVGIGCLNCGHKYRSESKGLGVPTATGGGNSSIAVGWLTLKPPTKNSTNLRPSCGSFEIAGYSKCEQYAKRKRCERVATTRWMQHRIASPILGWDCLSFNLIKAGDCRSF